MTTKCEVHAELCIHSADESLQNRPGRSDATVSRTQRVVTVCCHSGSCVEQVLQLAQLNCQAPVGTEGRHGWHQQSTPPLQGSKTYRHKHCHFACKRSTCSLPDGLCLPKLASGLHNLTLGIPQTPCDAGCEGEDTCSLTCVSHC